MEGHLEKLIELGKTYDERPALFFSADEVVRLASDHRDELLKYYRFVLPSQDALDRMMDKTIFHRWATEKGLPVPESHIVESKRDLDHVLRNIQYPIILKPLFRTEQWMANSKGTKVYKLQSERDAHEIDFDLLQAAPKLLVQRWIPGGDDHVHFCLSYIDRTGRETGYYAGKKLLQWPRLTGSTAIGVGTADARVHELTRDVLTQAGLVGLGSLEFKKSDQDDEYYITEPTVGRNNYQSYLAVAGGVNLVRMALYDALDDRQRAVKTKPRKALWLDEDYLSKATADSPDAVKLTRQSIAHSLGSTKIAFSHFSWRDPAPFVLFATRWLPRPLSRLVRKAVRVLRPMSLIRTSLL
jgi:D-aspartate ligase